jgi:hypothetical protein
VTTVIMDSTGVLTASMVPAPPWLVRLMCGRSPVVS